MGLPVLIIYLDVYGLVFYTSPYTVKYEYMNLSSGNGFRIREMVCIDHFQGLPVL